MTNQYPTGDGYSAAAAAAAAGGGDMPDTAALVPTLGSAAEQVGSVARPSVRLVVSPLDRWALRNHNKYADELTNEDGGIDDLATYVLKLQQQDHNLWEARNRRMIDDHRVALLKDPKGVLGKEEKELDELAAENAQLVILPDTYAYIMKVINTLAGARFTIRVPSRPDDTQAAQQVENGLYWFWDEWEARLRKTQQGSPMRSMPKHATVRGWQTILTMPDSTDERFPWNFQVVDPLEVYPTWGRKGLIRVIHQYDMKVDDCLDEWPETESLCKGMKDDDLVKCVSYYDSIYSFVCIQGRALGSDPNTSRMDRAIVKPPIPHGVVDFYDQPEVPWIIDLPNGDFSQGAEMVGRSSSGVDMLSRNSTELVGLSILYGVHDVYDALCRLASMLLTQVAFSSNPASVQFIMPGGESKEILITPGAHNVMYEPEKFQILNPAPNPTVLQPIMQMLQDRLNKVTLPSVFWGESFSGTSGYAINLLNNAARDVLLPYMESLKSVQAQISRRVLEIFLKITSNTVGAVQIPQRMPSPGQNSGPNRYVAASQFDAALIERAGVRVDITFGRVTPQDEAALAGAILPLVQANIISRETARDKLGIDDPQTELWRIFKESILQNPQIAAAVGPEALQMSDDDFLKAALQAVVQMQNMQAQQAQGEAVNQSGKPGAMPTSVLPNEQQAGVRAGVAPGAQNPADMQKRITDAAIARQSGGSLPRGG